MWILCSNRLILTPCSIYYYNIIFGFLSLVGEGFVGGRVYTSPFRNFLISDFVLQDTKKILCQRYQNCLRHLWLKFFIFHMSRGWFSWPLPPINPEVFIFRYIGKASRLNTLYGLETWYVQSSRHVETIYKVLGISDIFDVFMMSSMSKFFVIKFLATTSVKKFVETFDFNIEYVFW